MVVVGSLESMTFPTVSWLGLQSRHLFHPIEQTTVQLDTKKKVHHLTCQNGQHQKL